MTIIREKRAENQKSPQCMAVSFVIQESGPVIGVNPAPPVIGENSVLSVPRPIVCDEDRAPAAGNKKR